DRRNPETGAGPHTHKRCLVAKRLPEGRKREVRLRKGKRDDARKAHKNGEKGNTAQIVPQQDDAEERRLNGLGLGKGIPDREVAIGKKADKKKRPENLRKAAHPRIEEKRPM